VRGRAGGQGVSNNRWIRGQWKGWQAAAGKGAAAAAAAQQEEEEVRDWRQVGWQQEELAVRWLVAADSEL
jgi:hypothetical protein